MTDKRGLTSKLVEWFDSRFGLSHPLFRPVPQYALNPFYWLGALAVVAFVIQGVTGMILMLYYIPSPTQAYPSTLSIFQNVSNGRFLETVHLYTAYAMIMLAFMHLMRGFFVSVHKKPREAMWLVGMLMGFVTLGFGFTGYLLPWTVVSKSATDVGVGMVSALPQPVSSILTFLIQGGGDDATKLLRFFDLHIVVLPAVMVVLLAVKMYMLEAHGVAEPEGGIPQDSAQKLRPIFPDVTLYLFELSLLFGAGMLLFSALFPVTLPPEYTSAAAYNYTTQPDWYFLWIYQVLKISILEGPTGLAAALTIVTLVFFAIIFLPFFDRGSARSISRRPVYTTLGLVFVGEVLVLSYWGYLTPGVSIPLEQAALVIGGTALLISLGSLLVYRMLYSRAKRHLLTRPASVLPKTEVWSGVAFTILVAAGALMIGSTFDQLVTIAMGGFTFPAIAGLAAALVGLGLVVLATCFLIYRLDLRTGTIRRRVRLFEVGWSNE